MSLAHLFIRHHTGKPSRGAGAQAVHYLERTHQFAPEVKATVTYLDRQGERVARRDDLRFQETVNLPGWAEGRAERFFEAAATYERVNGRWATSWQASLPRELSEAQQIALARDFLATHLPERPLLWVLHDPVSTQGEHQPHIHVLFSERRHDGIERPARQMFKRYNPDHPEIGGAPKETFGRGDRQAPYRLREAWCASVNIHLEKAGVQEAWLDPRSLKARGVDREPVRYVYEENDQHKLEAKVLDERTPETRAQEQQLAGEWWGAYKRSMGLTEAHGQNPSAALAIIAREVREPGQRQHELRAMRHAIETGAGNERGGGYAPEQAQDRATRLEAPLIGNSRSKIYHALGDPNYGDVQPKNQVHFWSHAEADTAGYRAAVNQHYGQGATAYLEREIGRLQAEIGQLERQYSRNHGAHMMAQQRQRQVLHQRGLERTPSARGQDLSRVGMEDENQGLHGPALDKKRGKDRDGWEY